VCGRVSLNLDVAAKVQDHNTPWYKMSVRCVRQTQNEQVRHGTYTSGTIKEQHYHKQRGILVRQREQRPRIMRRRAEQLVRANRNSPRLARLREQMLLKIEAREARRAVYLAKYEREKVQVRAQGGCVDGVTLRVFRNKSEHVMRNAPEPRERLRRTTRAGQCVFLPPCAEFAEWCAATEGECCNFRAPSPFPQSTAGTTSLQRLVDADEQRQAAAEQQEVETAEQQQQHAEAEAPAEAATEARAAGDAVEAAAAPRRSNRVAAAAPTRRSKRSKK
jgi:hypothetical protein